MSFRAALEPKQGYYDQLKVVLDRVIPENISDVVMENAEAAAVEAQANVSANAYGDARKDLTALRQPKLEFHKAVVDVANRRVVELLTGQGLESMHNAGILGGSEKTIINALHEVTKVNNGKMPLPAAYSEDGVDWTPTDFERKIAGEIDGFAKREVQHIAVSHDASAESEPGYYDRLKELLKLKTVSPDSISDAAWEQAKEVARPKSGMQDEEQRAARGHEQALYHAKLAFEKAIVNAANRRLIKRLTGQGWKHMEDAGILEGYEPPIISALVDIKEFETGKKYLTADRAESVGRFALISKHREEIIKEIDVFVEQEAQRLTGKQAGTRDRDVVGTGQFTGEAAVASGSGLRIF